MQGRLVWGVVRALLIRSRSRLILQRASKDVVEGIAHRSLLSHAAGVIEVHKIPADEAAVKLCEIGGWQLDTSNDDQMKLVRHMHIHDVAEAVQLLIQVAALANASKLPQPNIYMENWHTARLEICSQRHLGTLTDNDFKLANSINALPFDDPLRKGALTA